MGEISLFLSDKIHLSLELVSLYFTFSFSSVALYLLYSVNVRTDLTRSWTLILWSVLRTFSNEVARTSTIEATVGVARASELVDI